MSYAEMLSFAGFHSFTGSDFTSSFFNKGKSSCWKTKNKQTQIPGSLSITWSELGSA